MKSLPDSPARLTRRTAWRLSGVVYGPNAEESLFQRYLAFLKNEGLDDESIRLAADIEDGDAPAAPSRRAHWTVLLAAGVLLSAILSMIGRAMAERRYEVLPAPVVLEAEVLPPVIEV